MAKITDPALIEIVDRLGKMEDTRKALEAKLKALGPEKAQLVEIITQYVESVGDDVLETKKYLMSLKMPAAGIKGYEVGYRYLLERVDEKTRKAAEALINADDNLRKVSRRLSVKKLKEEERTQLKGDMVSIANVVKSLRIANANMEETINLLKKQR